MPSRVKFDCKILSISCIVHHTNVLNVSVLSKLHIPQNWLCLVVKCQKLKYFVHIKRHGGLEKTILEGRVAGKKQTKATTKMSITDERRTSQVSLEWQQRLVD